MRLDYDYFVPVWFRNLLFTTFPAVQSWPEGLRLLGYLLFSTRSDSQGILIDRMTLASLEGKASSCRSNNYCGLDFLHLFRLSCFPNGGFDWTAYSYLDRRCREAHVKWPPEILDALYKLSSDTSPRVDLVTGIPASPKGLHKIRKDRRAAVASDAASVEWSKAQEVLGYHNSVSSQGYARLFLNAERARCKAYELHRNGELSYHALLSQLILIDQLIVDALPVYRPSLHGRTDRIFAEGMSLCGLKREIRKAFCAGWWDADLKASQLAIVAKLWDIPELKQFLQQGISFWDELRGWLGLRKDDCSWDLVKRVLKKLTYALIYGQVLHTSYHQQIRQLSLLGVPDAARVLKHPLIRVILDARKRMMMKVLEAGGLELPCGKWIPVEGRTLRERMRCVRSALARQAQAVELGLIHPIYVLAMSTRDFGIKLNQHDGVTISFSRRPKLWQRRINEAVAKRARELDIPTELEWEHLGADDSASDEGAGGTERLQKGGSNQPTRLRKMSKPFSSPVKRPDYSTMPRSRATRRKDSGVMSLMRPMRE